MRRNRENDPNTDDSQCPPVGMTACETKSSETDENISCDEKNTKNKEVVKTIAHDITCMNLKISNNVLQDTHPTAIPKKIKTSEETQSTDVKTDLCKKTFDMAEKQKAVTNFLSVGMKIKKQCLMIFAHTAVKMHKTK